MESKRNSAVKLTSKDAAELISSKLSRFFGVTDQEATSEQIYRAVAMSVREMLLEKRKSFQTAVKQKKAKRVYYLCMEFLLGRSLKNNLYNLGIEEPFAKALSKKYNINIDDLYELEPDAGLGNGGLGRLAACYMDSGAAVGIPLYGYGIRYRYGLFRQKFENGYQKELPDDWQRFGDPWSIRKEQEKQTIRFADMEVEAVPYDMPIIGKRVNVLRLYQAEGNENAEKISGVLYPPDDTEEGKLLRIRQEYFLSAAAVGDISERTCGLEKSCAYVDGRNVFR